MKQIERLLIGLCLGLFLTTSFHAQGGPLSTTRKWCSDFLDRVFPRILDSEPLEWQIHLERLGYFGDPELRVFDRHLVNRIERMLLELTREQKERFVSIMSTVTFNTKIAYAGQYYRVWNRSWIELDPNLHGHPMSRLVYLQTLRHLTDDIRSGFSRSDSMADSLGAELGAAGESYDYLSSVLQDPEFDLDLLKPSFDPQKVPSNENDSAWIKSLYSQHLHADLKMVQNLSREAYMGKSIRAGQRKVEFP